MIEIRTKNPEIATLLDGSIKITFKTESINLADFDKFKDKELVVNVKEYHQKRSMTQNNYLWVLINEIAERVKLGTEEVYRNFIKDYGVREYIAIPLASTDRFIKSWSQNGIGWFCEDLGESSKIDGVSKLAVYYGSSTYSTTEMARLLDGVIKECEELGISALTTEEALMLRNDNE